MKNLRKPLIWLFWLVLWQTAVILIDNSILLAGPVQVLGSLLGSLSDSGFWYIVGSSYMRIMGGFLMAFALGIFMGVFAYRFRGFREFLAPCVDTIKAIPVAAFVVLFLIWSGSSRLSFWCSLFIVFPNIYESTIAGLLAADGKLLEMAKVYRVGLLKKIFYIYRPAVMPYLISSSKITVGMAFKSGVAAEIIGVPSFTIGEKMYLSKIQLDTAGVLAWTLVVILLSIMTERLFLELLRWYAGRQDMLFFERAGAKERKEDKKTDVIKLENVEKTYQGETVLKNVTFHIERGGIYCIMGSSGVGKSTLLKLLMGLEKADAPDSISGLSGERISAVFQENRLCMETGAVNNVWLVRQGGRKADIRQELEEILPAESIVKPAELLSGGMKRRAAVCRAMMAESDMILMDEPFTGLDDETRERVIDYILRKRNNRTLVVATHREEDALQLGGKVIRIKEK